MVMRKQDALEASAKEGVRSEKKQVKPRRTNSRNTQIKTASEKWGRAKHTAVGETKSKTKEFYRVKRQHLLQLEADRSNK